jgi:hypothetical protein
VADPTHKKPIQEASGAATETERRRIGLVVHDDRGQASVEWHDAPSDYERPVLEILGNPELALKNDDVSYDPYARHTAAPKANPGNTTRTNLRKLSEWIKMKRELEERKLRGDLADDADDADDAD